MMERPKRNVPKRWDPDFIDPVHCRESPGARGGDKRLSLEVASLDDTLDTTQHSSASKKLGRQSKTDSLDTSTAESTPKSGRRAKAQRGASKPAATELREEKGGEEADAGSGGARRNKPCVKIACLHSIVKPACFARSTETCALSGYTSRWYHISIGEHYCNDCFDNFYRSQKEGYAEFTEWKRVWATNGMTEANVRTFLADQYLPFWVECSDCAKWRELPRATPVTPGFVQKYRCGAYKDGCRVTPASSDCERAEDPRAREAMAPSWINELFCPPYLISSPAAPFLVHYYPDGVGMSASTNARTPVKRKQGAKPARNDDGGGTLEGEGEGVHDLSGDSVAALEVEGVPSYFQPFMQPNLPPQEFSLPPNLMTDDEMIQFPHYAKEQQMYLAVRNLVVALWTLNPKQVLTVAQCSAHIVCRGLVRIRCIQELPSILLYLTRIQYINTGLLRGGSVAQLFPAPPDCKRSSVLVIGAGPAGLGAARQLINMGCQVTVLEARDRLGGRVSDDTSLGQCVARGAQIINGCVNNPFALLCHQTDQKISEMSDRCLIIDDSGELLDSGTDSRMNFHFNILLDCISDWRARTKPTNTGVSLGDKIMEMHALFLEETQFIFSPEEERLLHLHMSHMEHACGAALDQLSVTEWDQNEAMTQFGGPVCFLPHGYGVLMTELARDVDVRLNTQVVSVDYTGDRVKVVTFGETELCADHVLVTVPLLILRRDVIKFRPPLGPSRLAALGSVGAGVIEKVALRFDRCFWRKKTGGADVFGRIPLSAEDRGLFAIFYDLKESGDDARPGADAGGGTLVSFLTGRSARIIREKSDKEIVTICVDKLRKMFPEEDVEEPRGCLVTRWQDDPYAGMAYSYMALGCTGAAYDQLATSIDDKVFFAGEATNRAHPQSVTGAYLSGLREARRIVALQEERMNAAAGLS